MKVFDSTITKKELKEYVKTGGITSKKGVDFHDIKGQEHVKRGLEVAIAGGHSILLIGPEGAGKSKLSDACIELASELDLFYKDIGDVTKQKAVKEAEGEGLIIGNMLPCPCGNFTDPKRDCNCSPVDIQKYLGRVPGYILDRIQIHLEVPKLNLEALTDKRRGECSANIRERITAAIYDNTVISDTDKEASELLKLAILELGISARAYDKILKVARTIADLDSKDTIEAHHISEAISYRSLDRNLWG